MVIILQQTLEDGQRFVSTVIEGTGSVEETSFTSNFSMSSQHSISERSAVYKQRIDSLFGRHSRLSPFNLNVEPFSVRINGKSVTPSEGCRSALTPAIGHMRRRSPNLNSDHDDEDDSYSKITDKCSSSSVITDSLNHKSTRNQSPWTDNVSSVRITCDADSESPQPHSIIITSSPNNEHESAQVKPVLVTHQKAVHTSPAHNSSAGKNMWKNGTYGECPGNSEKKSLEFVRSGPGGMLQFPVEYLGSVPVEGNTTSLQDLQLPLKNLYMDFLSGKNVMTGQLSITSDGIRFEAPKLRLVNPFSTIAVWAAIKFVARGEQIPTECAFMPLISDPEGQDKSRLFGRMDSELSRVYLDCFSGSKKGFKNPPLFACVMREASFSLDCHAFACKCAEDAIVVAANLYQSLVDKMRSGNKEGESGYGSLTRTSPSAVQSSPNQNRSSSSASSTGMVNEISGGNSSSSGSGGRAGDRRTCRNPRSGPSSSSGPDDKNEHRAVFSDSESIAPIRPPRRKKKPSEIPSGNLKRYNSDDSILLKMPHRRKSFKRNYQCKTKKRVQISTPDETSSADSVNESIDQVLDRIINPGGMSFNDLKPSYQDLILKIALTLTQDQLYQKSKQAMKKHQQLYIRKKSKNHPSGDASEDNSQFLNHLLKSFSKITSSKATTPSKRFTKSAFSSPINKPSINPLPAPKKVILKKPKEEEGFMSFCSGCVCENCSDKCYCSLPSKSNLKINGLSHQLPSSVGTPLAITPCPLGSACSEKDKPRKLCGYDSESCAESEKCYCSLQRVKSNGLKIYNINLDTETSDTDTNSYDLEPFNQQQETSSSSNGKTVSSRSVEILSYHPSKRLAYSLSPANNNLHQHIQTTSAVVHFEDSLNLQSNICPRSSSSNGKSISSYCSPQKLESADSKSKRDKVLLISGSSPSARVVYKDVQNYHGRMEHGDGKKSRNSMHRSLLDIMEDDCNDEDQDGVEGEDEDGIAPEKVLSMKKTAEIAAMFTDLKLDQTTNVVPDLASGNFDSMQNTEDSTASLDFEASLGYLP